MLGREIARLLLGSMVVYVSMSACGGGGAPNGARGGDGGGGIVDALTDPVPDAVADTSGSRIKVQYYVGTDGSKISVGAYDSMLDVTCAYTTAADGSTRCLPSGPEVSDASLIYADAACTTVLAAAHKGCAAGKYAVGTTPSAGACSITQVHLYSLGAAFTPGANVYELAGSSTCAAVSASTLTASFDLYQLGPELPAQNFVQATLQTE